MYVCMYICRSISDSHIKNKQQTFYKSIISIKTEVVKFKAERSVQNIKYNLSYLLILRCFLILALQCRP